MFFQGPSACCVREDGSFMVGPAITPLSALLYRLVVTAYERVDGHKRLGRDIEIDPAFDAAPRASSPSQL